ncbi:MAG: tRNA (adenosine(37)-N6)-threonylcarbamoyltransferase complex dimerization subunit type 1 TsaB [Burkholderiales bacterium]|nr:tRNA (adenosine(37)-N6)-threonylcarbamoyltransferase complex dimerization subunit type 1 TsaB [Burkholderiales bacterium]
MTALLAFDTAGERMTVVLGQGGRHWSRSAAGGSKASAALVPAILGLLAEAGLGLADLDAIAFGRGPGAFTGLRTACSVAQGLALGAGKPVLPIDSLLVVAEAARAGATSFRVWAAIDARMAQIYAAEYRYADGGWTTLEAPMLLDCAGLEARWRDEPPAAVAGDALLVFGDRLRTGAAQRFPEARAGAEALLALAASAWRDGAGVDPALALPLYVRDKVAQTTRERDALRAAAA